MCGIVGLALREPAGCDLSLSFDKAVADLAHRGPDMHGKYQNKRVYLGHTRLSIIDLSDAAIQPMVSTSQQFIISYNGEVYNFKELQHDLSLDDLRTKSDTEVILSGFAKIGTAIFTKLNGMFAFSIYNKLTNKLWLVRDRVGIKPLYYRVTPECLFFVSEIKSLLAFNEDESACKVSSLHEWLFYGNTLGEDTLYKDIKKILPGHYLEIDLNSFEYELVEYWSPKQLAEMPRIKKCTNDKVSKVRFLLEEAVKRQLVSDVPVGVFLSGGIDSSAITAFASKHYDGKLATYTAGFDYDKGINELPKARALAKHYGTEHHEMYISGFEIPDIVEKMVIAHDSPFSDAANIPLYLMSSQISSKTKVVLQGDGGDELFGGYKRYTTLKYYNLLNPIAKLAKHLNELTIHTPHYYRRKRYLHALGAENLARSLALLLTEESGSSRPASLFTAELKCEIEKHNPFKLYEDYQSYFKKHSPVDQMAFIDSMIILPDIFLEKVDRSTMAASVEVRVPFLDNLLVEYCMRISAKDKVPWGKKKYILKQALTGIVPEDVLYGPKTGFSVPYGYWLRTSLKPLFFDHLESFNNTYPNILNGECITNWYEQHETRIQDRSFLLWKVLNFLIWSNKYHINFRF